MTASQSTPLETHPAPLDHRLAELRKLFPEAVRDGVLDPQAVAEMIDPSRAAGGRFGLSWYGKDDAIRALRARPVGALHLQGDSATQPGGHDLVAADNLEAMKLLQAAYAGKVRACFVDPPYNTGRDFVYRDDFTDPLTAYLRNTGQLTEDGLRTDSDAETAGRRHSGWLTMIYPRLLLAHELLAENGVIFVTIDSIEASHLRVVMDEIFTEEAFVASIAWQRRSGPPNDKVLGPVHDTVLVYAKCPADPKDPENSSLYRVGDLARIRAKYTNPDNHPLGDWCPDNLSANGDGGRYVAALDFPITNPNTGAVYNPPRGRCWQKSPEDVARYIAERRIDFGPDGQGGPRLRRFWSERVDGVSVPDVWTNLGPALRTDLTKLVSIIRSEAQAAALGALPPGTTKAVEKAVKAAVGAAVRLDDDAYNSTRLGDPWHAVGSNKGAKAQLKSILAGTPTTDDLTGEDDDDTEGEEPGTGLPFQTPKPRELVELCLKMATRSHEEDLVLDFFAGSGTTTAAAIRLNASDGGNRRSISIQLPEPCDHPDYDDLFDVTVQRVRNEAAAARSTDPIRVWRYAAPFVKPWPAGEVPEDEEAALELFEAATERVERTADPGAVSYEVALTCGLPLDAIVTEHTVDGVVVHEVSDPRGPAKVYVTLSDDLPSTLAESLGLDHHDLLVCRDASLTDTTKANIALRCQLRTL